MSLIEVVVGEAAKAVTGSLAGVTIGGVGRLVGLVRQKVGAVPQDGDAVAALTALIREAL